MKKSRYNHLIALDGGGLLAYNCLTGAIAEIDTETASRIRILLDSPEEAETDEDREIVESLVGAGYLVEDSTDELGDLWAESRRNRQQMGTLALTIAPTLGCNFDCDYCFISRSAVRMDEKTQKALLEYVENRMDEIGGLRLSWFGGEPTLCFSMIDKMQTALNEMAARHNVKIGPVSMVSNGHLLNRKMAQRMKELGFIRVQITLDGPAAVHDTRRKLRNGKGTFDTILSNLTEIVDLLKVHVRINVDKDNAQSAIEVMQILDRLEILPKVTVAFAQVRSIGDVCASIRDRCFYEEAFSNRLVDLYEELINQGIYRVESPRSHNAVYCGALTEHCLAVSPTGHLFRCRDSLTLDPEKAIGDIFCTPPSEAQKRNLEKFRSWDPFQFQECRECDILPICLGGCPLQAQENTNGNKGTCSPWKYNLEKMFRLRYRCEAEKDRKAGVK